jgi:uncharacterized protein YbaR (Trm112 family)
MAEDIRTHCPKCQTTLEHHEEVTVRRKINRITADGTLQIYGDRDFFDDDGENERLACPNCGLTLPLPEKVEYI